MGGGEQRHGYGRRSLSLRKEGTDQSDKRSRGRACAGQEGDPAVVCGVWWAATHGHGEAEGGVKSASRVWLQGYQWLPGSPQGGTGLLGKVRLTWRLLGYK